MTQEELSTRDWHVDALTLWGNVNIVTQYINNIEIPQLRWVHRNLTEWYDDELGMADFLIQNNPQIVELMEDCQFQNGKELTGKLREWFMNPDNQYDW